MEENRQRGEGKGHGGNGDGGSGNGQPYVRGAEQNSGSVKRDRREKRLSPVEPENGTTRPYPEHTRKMFFPSACFSDIMK